MKGQELVNEVVMEWESVVNRVATVGSKKKFPFATRATERSFPFN